jgi:hypothetical protein
MNVIHIKENELYYDSFLFHTNDASEIAIMTRLMYKIFGDDIDKYYSTKNTLTVFLRHCDFIEQIPDDHVFFYITNIEVVQEHILHKLVPANPYNLKFLVDKEIARLKASIQGASEEGGKVETPDKTETKVSEPEPKQEPV